MEQTSFTYDRELEVNGESNVDRTMAQSPVSSFDQGEVIWMQPDAGCQTIGIGVSCSRI